MEFLEQVVSYSDELTSKVDNYYIAHIFSEECTFTNNIDSIIYNGEATIGGKYMIPKYIGTVWWYWTDDEGQLHTNRLNNVPYFIDPPVNILSSCTGWIHCGWWKKWLLINIKYHIFTWDFGKSK